MAAPAITIKGLDRVNAQLAKLSGAEGKKAIRRGMRSSLKPLKVLIKALEPLGPTGDLKRSVKIQGAKGRKGSIRLTVGFGAKSFKSSKWHGSFADLGTSKQDGSHAVEIAFKQLGEPTKADAEAKILTEVLNLIDKS